MIKLESKQDYVDAHKKLWNGIIDYVKEHGYVYQVYPGPVSIKIKVFHNLFDDGTPSPDIMCFGCMWRDRQRRETPNYSRCNETCLFKVTNKFSITKDCLSGLYRKFLEAKTMEEIMGVSEKIRDFEVRQYKIERNTKEDYHKAHIMLWNGIIDYIRDMPTFHGTGGVKKLVWNRMFKDNVEETCCFGCMWKHKIMDSKPHESRAFRCKDYCLFDTHFESPGDCLDGLFSKYTYAENKVIALKVAYQIRDFKVREEIKEDPDKKEKDIFEKMALAILSCGVEDFETWPTCLLNYIYAYEKWKIKTPWSIVKEIRDRFSYDREGLISTLRWDFNFPRFECLEK